MPYLQFDGDDIAVSHSGTALLTSGARRTLLQGLTKPESEALSTAAIKGYFDASLAERLAKRLCDSNFGRIEQTPPTQRHTSWTRMPARIVAAVARPLTPMTQPLVMAMLTASSIVAMLVRRPTTDAIDLYAAPPTTDVAIAIALLLAALIAHELGHAAACLRATGLVGPMRLRTFSGIPALTTDVTPIALATRRQRAAISAAGLAFQLPVTAAISILPGAGPQTATAISIASALFAAIPFPGSDGYWLIADTTKWTIGPYNGPNGSKTLTNLVYTACVAGTAIALSGGLLAQAYRLASYALTTLNTSCPTTLVTAPGSIALAAIAATLIYRTILFAAKGKDFAKWNNTAKAANTNGDQS